jgi:hypothetical protein
MTSAFTTSNNKALNIIEKSGDRDHYIDRTQQLATPTWLRPGDRLNSRWSWQRFISMTYYACIGNTAKWSAAYHSDAISD